MTTSDNDDTIDDSGVRRPSDALGEVSWPVIIDGSGTARGGGGGLGFVCTHASEAG